MKVKPFSMTIEQTDWKAGSVVMVLSDRTIGKFYDKEIYIVEKGDYGLSIGDWNGFDAELELVEKGEFQLGFRF